MTQIVPIEVHDGINRVEYLLEAMFMAVSSIDNPDQVNALHQVISLAQKDLMEVERHLEEIDAPEGGGA